MAKRQAFTTAALAALAAAAGDWRRARADARRRRRHTTSWTGTVGEDRFGDAALQDPRSLPVRPLFSRLGRRRRRPEPQLRPPRLPWRAGPPDRTLALQGRLRAGAGRRRCRPSRRRRRLPRIRRRQLVDRHRRSTTSPRRWKTASPRSTLRSSSARASSTPIEYGRRAGARPSSPAAPIGRRRRRRQGDSLEQRRQPVRRRQWRRIDRAQRPLHLRADLRDHARRAPRWCTWAFTARLRERADDGAFQYRTRPLNGRGDRLISSTALGEQDTRPRRRSLRAVRPVRRTGRIHPARRRIDRRRRLRDRTATTSTSIWSITGESRAYRGNQGSFGAIVPRRPMDRRRHGPLRCSRAATTSSISPTPPSAPTAASRSAYAVGLDWVPIDHVRFKLNYAMSEMDRTAAARRRGAGRHAAHAIRLLSPATGRRGGVAVSPPLSRSFPTEVLQMNILKSQQQRPSPRWP